MASSPGIARICITTLSGLAVGLFLVSDVSSADEAVEAETRLLREAGRLSYPNIDIGEPVLLAQVYERRDFALAWDAAADIDAVLQVIRDSAYDGLRPTDYHLERLELTRNSLEAGRTLTGRGRAALDILMSDALTRLIRDLRFGKTSPTVRPARFTEPDSADESELPDLLERLVAADALASEITTVLPHSRNYLRLRAALNQYRLIREHDGWPVVGAGPTILPGESDDRLETVARRLAATGDLDGSRGSMTRYDEELVAAVQRFQQRHGLPADGKIGPATRRAMNVTVDARIDQLRVNLERSRWSADIAGDDVVRVNVPAYRAELIRDGAVVATTRVIVGQPDTETPALCSEIRYIVLNPTWTVPHSIASEELLGIIQADPGYLARGGYDVIDRDGRTVDADTVDWQRLAPGNFPYTLEQQPGPRNQLGQLKFVFPNAFSVFMHDTAARSLFEQPRRALSHGCIRVDEPVDLAAELLREEGWSRQALEAQIDSGETRTVFLPEPVPLVVSYLTTEVDEDGRVLFHPDIYDRDAIILAELDAPPQRVWRSDLATSTE